MITKKEKNNHSHEKRLFLIIITVSNLVPNVIFCSFACRPGWLFLISGLTGISRRTRSMEHVWLHKRGSLVITLFFFLPHQPPLFSITTLRAELCHQAQLLWGRRAGSREQLLVPHQSGMRRQTSPLIRVEDVSCSLVSWLSASGD